MAVMCSRFPREITPTTGHALAASPRDYTRHRSCARGFPREITPATGHVLAVSPRD